jgi:hypothetical protein
VPAIESATVIPSAITSAMPLSPPKRRSTQALALPHVERILLIAALTSSAERRSPLTRAMDRVFDR